MPLPGKIVKISDTVWELPKAFAPGMLVPGRIFATSEILQAMEEAVFSQLANVAKLPGILKHAYCMPDGHWGYGFPIGGVAAMDPEKGVISPGGIGFDINCGMRLVLTQLTYDDIKPYLPRLVDRLFQRVPTGVGCRGFVKLSRKEFRKVIERGARWCVEQGYGWAEDLERTEEQGGMTGADAKDVSDKAVDRGYDQIGTLGSGNHYLEIQVARPENVFEQEVARAFGITIPNQVVVMFHCGSRGFGHQVATDYLQGFLKVMTAKYQLKVFDRELACAPLKSAEGQAYFSAMKCAVNMAFANRQVILHRIREVFEEVLGRRALDLGLHQVYDVAHNIAKIERHEVNGKERPVLIHRKGATRAFGPGMPGLPEVYRRTGQPVIIGGSMETGSYLLAGLETGKQAFYSTAHGSGRVMSRAAARKKFRGQELLANMRRKGIYVNTASFRGLSEEAGGAYKDIHEVTRATEAAGLSKRVASFVPVGNIKG